MALQIYISLFTLDWRRCGVSKSSLPFGSHVTLAEMPSRRLRLPIGIMVIFIGALVPVFSKDFFGSGTTARHLAAYSAIALVLSGLILVLLHLKTDKKY